MKEVLSGSALYFLYLIQGQTLSSYISYFFCDRVWPWDQKEISAVAESTAVNFLLYVTHIVGLGR